MTTEGLQTIAPEMYKKDPTAEVHISAYMVDAPSLTIQDAGSFCVNGTAAFAFSIVQPGNVTENVPENIAFVVGCPIAASARVGTKGQAITGELTSLSCRLALMENEIGGDIDVESLDENVTFGIVSVMVPALNQVLQPGLPLPTLFGVSFE